MRSSWLEAWARYGGYRFDLWHSCCQIDFNLEKLTAQNCRNNKSAPELDTLLSFLYRLECDPPLRSIQPYRDHVEAGGEGSAVQSVGSPEGGIRPRGHFEVSG